MEQKRLYRTKTDRVICGVCSGIGEYMSLDPVVVRLIWIIAGFCSAGTALLAYIITAIVMPERN